MPHWLTYTLTHLPLWSVCLSQGLEDIILYYLLRTYGLAFKFKLTTHLESCVCVYVCACVMQRISWFFLCISNKLSTIYLNSHFFQMFCSITFWNISVKKFNYGNLKERTVLGSYYFWMGKTEPLLKIIDSCTLKCRFYIHWKW